MEEHVRKLLLPCDGREETMHCVYPEVRKITSYPFHVLFELFAERNATYVSPHLILVSQGQIFFGQRFVKDNQNRLGTHEEMHQHLATINVIQVELDEFPYQTHATCLWIDHTHRTIDCFDPQLSHKESDQPLETLLSGYTFRSKSKRSSFHCPQYVRQMRRVLGFGQSDRFCELDCLLYCQTRHASAMSDSDACKYLTHLTTEQLVDAACSLLRSLADSAA